MISPQINVSETDNEIRVSARLPGVSENDIQVDLDDDADWPHSFGIITP